MSNIQEYMIASASYTKMMPDNSYKRVKDAFLIPASTFTNGEEFMYTKVAEGIKGEFKVKGLVSEQVDGIFYADREIQSDWHKAKVTTPDPDSEKAKSINLVYYVNAESVKIATDTLVEELGKYWSEFRIKNVGISPVVDVFLKERIDSSDY